MSTKSLSDNAGVVAPAPVIYGTAIAVGLAAEFVLPIALLPRLVGLWLGAVIIVISIPIVVSAFRSLARAHTAFDARKPTTGIVTDGAFRYSRNPTYWSLALLHVGIALVLGSLWVLLMVAPAVVAVHWGVVLREERYLEAKFGEEYRSYATKVRRWV
ncbi:MAG: isoprenylcysteine carboxylmethyltransferase family protein [Gallionella sp.]